jgi:hypothetical protein
MELQNGCDKHQTDQIKYNINLESYFVYLESANVSYLTLALSKSLDAFKGKKCTEGLSS